MGMRAGLGSAAWVLVLVVALGIGVGSTSPASAASPSIEDPQGDAAFVTGNRGVVQVVGWVFDRNDFGYAVETQVRVDGAPVTTARASLPSDYLYPYGVPGQHAFWSAVTLPPGGHTVCVVWMNVGGGSDTAGPCHTIDIAERTPADWPQGDLSVTMDNPNGRAIVMGWAFDHSELYSSIDVDVFVDGQQRGRWSAGSDSPYLYPYGVPGRHAFFGAVDVTSGGHEVCVVARDRGPGGDVTIGCRSITADVPSYDPEGAVTITMRPNGAIAVTGWAFDRSNLSAPIQLAVFQNGTMTAAPVASGPSLELAPYGVFGKGVDVWLPPVTRSASVSVCVLGLNIGSGQNRWLACSDIDARGTRAVADQSSASSLTVLVNKRTPLSPYNYAPPLWPLSSVGVGGGEALRPEAAVAMRDMVSAAGAQGIGLQVGSGFRSYDSQVSVFNRYVRELGVSGAELVSARPSFSEHQTGLAADVTAPAEGCAITQCFGGTTAGRWVADNAWRFGFIIRYPNGYTSVTGYEWEPWHVRYVGTDVAREMHDGGIPTYEQYLGAAAAPTY